MSRPATIPHLLKNKFHDKRSCIDVRNQIVHAIKINTNNRTWINKIDHQTALVAVNPKTRRENRLVRRQTTPFHMLSFGVGADTLYWGRYLCLQNNTGSNFELVFVDNGALDECLPAGHGNTHRSLLETQWDKAFAKNNIKNSYEPATIKIKPCAAFPSGKEYTPDVWLIDSNTFIEIKGPPATEEEFEKCKAVRELGFNILMFNGNPNGFDCYDFREENTLYTHYNSYLEYLSENTKNCALALGSAKKRKYTNHPHMRHF